MFVYGKMMGVGQFGWVGVDNCYVFVGGSGVFKGLRVVCCYVVIGCKMLQLIDLDWFFFCYFLYVDLFV